MPIQALPVSLSEGSSSFQSGVEGLSVVVLGSGGAAGPAGEEGLGVADPSLVVRAVPAPPRFLHIRT